MTASLIARVAAAEAVIAKFDGRPFAWGSADCLRMVAHGLRELGHAPPLREAGSYRSPLGARKALKRQGYPTLLDWVDTWGLRRIPPALALPADVLALPSEDPAIPALALVLSNGRVFSLLEGRFGVYSLAKPDAPLAAWSV